MAKGGAGVLAAVMVPVLAIAMLLWVLFFGGSAAAACLPGGGPVNIAAIPADAKVGAYGHDQLVNAAAIVNAGAAKGLGSDGQTLGVQTAIGESSLVNIDYGDNAVNPDGSIADSIGLFQQQSSWGTVEERMNPTTSAGFFYDRLVKVEGWQAMEPSIAINKVQRNSDPNHYTKYRGDAVAIMAYFATLGDGSATPGATTPASTSTATPALVAAGCAAISGDSQALAQGLVKAMEEGRLTFLEDRYAQQVRDVAAGTASADCGIDLRILQIMTVALNTFDKVGVSDINRKCTGETGYGAGTASSHYIDGGGHAVDFYSFNGTATTGCDANALKLLGVLDPQVPNGTRAGQIQCRSVTYVNISGFYDPATHLHIDMGFTDAPLTTTG
ncbi:hypothetical protein [Microbacterium enclense]|uniref:Uncharacterized protein n=1 Tax=Microbacterium enclense TaxID=993073 RepID=A0A1G6RED3_9MICO|nr:hypothetical protein [Microbacterium enclense]KSU51582.1 hypothetical protein AS029_16175 [Microbacterium enclense]SDD03002.1 hypothetical protein SAMN05216418_0108 [Microbacterium enclense]